MYNSIYLIRRTACFKERKMRVAIFTETYLPVINGVVTHIKTLKDGLEAMGHKVLIVTADSRVKKHKTTEDVMYCPAVKLKKIYNYDIASPLSVERLKLIKEFDPDIIHIHNEFGIGISGVLIARILKIPIVYTLHTMYDDYVYYVANKHFCKFVTNATHKYAKVLSAVSSAITGPSEKVSEYFRKCGVKRPVNVIPNSVEIDKFCVDNINLEKAAEIRRKLGYTDADTVVCFCGRLGKEKNVTLLLENWAECVSPEDGLRLLILGGGPMLEQHTEEAKALGIDNMVHFTGAISHDLLPEYYAVAQAYVTASLSDTCSISMLEGMAMRLPVIHIRDELNAGQVIDGLNGYIYSDAEEMYNAMLKIRDMPCEELEAFGAQVRQSIITAGSARLAGSIYTIYEAVLADERAKKELRRLKKTEKKKILAGRKNR